MLAFARQEPKVIRLIPGSDGIALLMRALSQYTKVMG